MPHSPQLNTQQHGVAILTALLILAVVATIGISLATHLQLDIRRTGNIIANEQALIFVSGAEELTKYLLQIDHDDNNIDHYEEAWAEEKTFPFEGGYLKGKLSDLQGCFNINSLVKDNAVNVLARDRFNNLLSQLSLTPELTNAIIDWIDSGAEVTSPGGGEDEYYMNLEKPYRTSNQVMQSASELRLIRGFEDTEVYDAVAPLVCAFGHNASININTAPETVLLSLSTDITQSDAKNIIDNRPYDTVADMITTNKLSKANINTGQLSTATEYFLLSTEVVVGQSRVQVYSILWRESSGKTSVLMHSIGAY